MAQVASGVGVSYIPCASGTSNCTKEQALVAGSTWCNTFLPGASGGSPGEIGPFLLFIYFHLPTLRIPELSIELLPPARRFTEDTMKRVVRAAQPGP